MKELNHYLTDLGLFIVSIVFLVGLSLPNIVYGQEVLRGLDLSHVGFMLHVKGQYREGLEKRAIKQFADAGLKLGTMDMFPRVELNLEQEEIKNCKGSVIYQPKLELLEEVALVRSGHKRIATTWFLGQKFGYESEPLSLSDLEQKQDEMLKVFIDQYKFLNPKK